ncbi:shikimate kinase [Aliiroseovarius sp. S253]|uniref:shikimate kinase n=1 Tax=Aliiroseovarius sp. S253 TaxID=3415133 RepID=UPI003C7D53A5
MVFSPRSRHSGKKSGFGQVGAALAFKVKKSIVMVGMMGAGKTAVGQALATRLDVPFLDSDEEIVRAANMTISEIFERDGEAFFRDRETEVIGRLLDGPRAILSTGGGAFMAERNRTMIGERGVSLLLRANLELLWNRVKHKDTRPLLRTTDPKKTLTEIYNTRVPVYELAELAVDAHPDYTIAQMTDAVIEVLKTRPDVLEETPE